MRPPTVEPISSAHAHARMHACGQSASLSRLRCYLESAPAAKIQNDLRILTERLARINDNLARKISSRNEYDKTIQETEAAYSKVSASTRTDAARTASSTRSHDRSFAAAAGAIGATGLKPWWRPRTMRRCRRPRDGSWRGGWQRRLQLGDGGGEAVTVMVRRRPREGEAAAARGQGGGRERAGCRSSRAARRAAARR